MTASFISSSSLSVASSSLEPSTAPERRDASRRLPRPKEGEGIDAAPRAGTSGFAALFLQPAMAAIVAPLPITLERSRPLSASPASERVSAPPGVQDPSGASRGESREILVRQESRVERPPERTIQTPRDGGRQAEKSRENAGTPRSAPKASGRAPAKGQDRAASKLHRQETSPSARPERSIRHRPATPATGDSEDRGVKPGGPLNKTESLESRVATRSEDAELLQTHPATSREETADSERDVGTRGPESAAAEERFHSSAALTAELAVPMMSGPSSMISPIPIEQSARSATHTQGGPSAGAGEARISLSNAALSSDPSRNGDDFPFGVGASRFASSARTQPEHADLRQVAPSAGSGETLSTEADRPAIRVMVELDGAGGKNPAEFVRAGRTNAGEAVEAAAHISGTGNSDAAARATESAVRGSTHDPRAAQGTIAAKAQELLDRADQVVSRFEADSTVVAGEPGTGSVRTEAASSDSANQAPFRQPSASASHDVHSFSPGAPNHGSVWNPDFAQEQLPAETPAPGAAAGSSSSNENSTGTAQVPAGSALGQAEDGTLGQTAPSTHAAHRQSTGTAALGAAERQTLSGGQKSDRGAAPRALDALDPVLSPERGADSIHEMRAARSLRVDLSDVNGGESLKLHFLQRGNASSAQPVRNIDVRIQSSSAHVVRELRAEIPALLRHLERAGFDTGRTSEGEGAGERGDARDASSSRHGSGQPGSGGGESPAGGHETGQNPGNHQRSAPQSSGLQRAAANADSPVGFSQMLHRMAEVGKHLAPPGSSEEG